MTVDKRISYEVQSGAKNYLGKQKQVTAPIKWKSSPDSPETELAYITKAEKDLLVKKDLHGSLKNGVNRGPSGIMSLDGYGSFDDPSDPGKDTGMSGAATSAAEAGGGSGADRRELDSYIDYGSKTQLPPGVTRQLPQDIKDYRNAFIAAGGGQRVNPGFFDSRFTVSPQEIRSARDYVRNRSPFKSRSLNPGLAGFFTGGGFLGNVIRGIGQAFGLGKKYDEPTYDMSRFNNTRIYEGTMDPTVNPEYYNDLGNELMLATKASPATGFVTKGPDFSSLLNQNQNQKGNTLANVNFNRMGSYLDGVTDKELYGESNLTGPDYLKSFEGLYSLPEKEDFLGNTSEDYQISPNNINAYQAKSDVASQFQDLVRQAGINETQQKMIDSAANMYSKVNPGEKIDPTTQQEIFDSVKKFDTKAKEKTLGFFL